MSYPISSSLLDGIVLAVVERESTYGYRITQDVAKGTGYFRIYAVSGTSAADEGRAALPPTIKPMRAATDATTRSPSTAEPLCGSTASTGRTTAAGSTRSFLEG